MNYWNRHNQRVQKNWRENVCFLQLIFFKLEGFYILKWPKNYITCIFVVAVRKQISYLFCHCMLIWILCYLISQRWGVSCVRVHFNRLLLYNSCVFSKLAFFLLTVTLHIEQHLRLIIDLHYCLVWPGEEDYNLNYT